MSPSTAEIEDRLAAVVDPHTQCSLVAGKSLMGCDIGDERITIKVSLGYPGASWHDSLRQQIIASIADLAGTRTMDVQISTRIMSHAVQKNLKPMPGVRNIIAVASGKGGVGKSTTAVNLALALQSEGARVGLLDADIYGPSQPMMLGMHSRPETADNKLQPVMAYGLQTMSIGYLIEEDTPMIWRGPMVTGTLQQLLNDTAWQDLDYLVIDLPPGTGDVQLTLAQQVPVSGAVIVTTPQDIALLDAQKALRMFEKVSVPVLGIIENMSVHICSNCGHSEDLFGSGGGDKMADKFGTRLLGKLPLNRQIREQADNGYPTVAAEPESHHAGLYREIARNLAAGLALKARDFSHRFPNISIVKG